MSQDPAQVPVRFRRVRAIQRSLTFFASNTRATSRSRATKCRADVVDLRATKLEVPHRYHTFFPGKYPRNEANLRATETEVPLRLGILNAARSDQS